MRRSMRSGNEHEKVFWTLFVATAGLVLARVPGPATAQQVVGIITEMGRQSSIFPSMQRDFF